MSPLIFLKLGGSLITEKDSPSTPRPDVIERLAHEIKAAREARPEARIILGHGSGSFGHMAASRYGTRQGVAAPEEWAGFADVWLAASALNRIVIEALHLVGLPTISFAAVPALAVSDGKITHWDLSPIQQALEHGLIPLVYGDVVFDEVRGGTILSTEDLFAHLARYFKPERILLAGLESGVWADYPARTQLIETITPANLEEWRMALGSSASTDVTGGMTAKVQQMLALLEALPGCEAYIFSGIEPGNVRKTLQGETSGTRLAGK
jgi:isopentenyl phosphate kinase